MLSNFPRSGFLFFLGIPFFSLVFFFFFLSCPSPSQEKGKSVCSIEGPEWGGRGRKSTFWSEPRV